jgi:hypothetical protein
MKDIRRLIPDIYKLLEKPGGWWDEHCSRYFAEDLSRRLASHFTDEKANTLRLSRLGPCCPRALWASIHAPGEAEPILPWVKNKLAFGHYIESQTLAQARASGHLVVGEQDDLYVDGILGHRDAVIDGCVVDVKSTTSIGFKKFKDKSFGQNDGFGYLDQLDAYVVGSREDPLVTVKDRGYILAVDKQLGHMVLYEHFIREDHIHQRISKYKQIVALGSPPPCECGTEALGEGGNVGLDTRASYSAFKYYCFPQLRTFLYSKGPVHLVHVEKRPMNKNGPIPEVNRYGQLVFR